MKKRQLPFTQRIDTPVTRKRRLQARLQEISDRSDIELNGLRKSLSEVNSSFQPRNNI